MDWLIETTAEEFTQIQAGTRSLAAWEARTPNAGGAPRAGDGIVFSCLPEHTRFCHGSITAVTCMEDAAQVREIFPDAVCHISPDASPVYLCEFYPDELPEDRRRRVHFSLSGRNGYPIPVRLRSADDCRRVLICTHGLFGNMTGSTADGLTDALPDTTVLSWDLPGHGESPATGADFTQKNCESDLETVIRFAQSMFPSVPVCLFGTSFGGYLSLLHLFRHPNEISCGVFRCVAVKMHETIENVIVGPKLTPQFREKGGVELGFARKMILYYGFYEETANTDLLNLPHGALPPVLLIHGTADRLAPIRDAKMLARHARFDFLEIPGAGHTFDRRGDTEAVVTAAAAFYRANGNG